MRVVGLYIVLVGVPFAGLMGVLHVGESLSAPRAVGGVWRFEVDRAAPNPLLERLLPAEEPTLKLVQSGPRVEVAAAHEHSLGFIDGSALEISGSDRTWKLEAALLPGDDPALVGTLTLAGAPLPVRASRMRSRPSEAGEGGH
jgi:hypothetical protein